MKFKTLFLALLISFLGKAQILYPECAAEEIIEKFQYYFNTTAYDKIFLLFDDEMKKRNTISSFQSTMEKPRKYLGKIRDITLIKNEGKQYYYKSRFERGSLFFSFTINNRAKLSSMTMDSYNYDGVPKFKRNTTSFILPFNDEWYVFWGGNSISQNYHNSYPSMYGAFDFWVMGANGKSYKTDGKTNEDYFAFGKEIIAPCDGRVVMVLNRVKDNTWPKMNKTESYGNFIIIETKRKEYILFAHMKYGSIVHKEGELIAQGDTIGLCGNSGNSTEPHLHFALQNTNDIMSTQGARSFFKEVLVNGETKKEYSPVRGDKVRNLNQ